MILFFKLFKESFRFAGQALRGNLLRTTLSLLGVTVGIFSIVAVLTVVDALDSSLKKSFSFLGDRVIYVEKWPWQFGGGEYPWWKYIKRPQPDLEDYLFLEANLTQVEAISLFDVKGGATLKYKNNSMTSVAIMGATHTQTQVSEMKIERGRFFSKQEADHAKNVVVIGSTVAEELFGRAEPMGKQIKIKGIRFNVVGILEKQGENLLPTPNFDEMCMIPYYSMAKMYASRNRGLSPIISLKGKSTDPSLRELEAEARGLLRAHRRLKPKEEDNFALNRTEAFADFMQSLIGVLKFASWCIGSFALLVGGFGIANIMFVSVKERTNLIGIQKSLGAKNYFILLQFLFEAIFLSVFGGMFGLLLVSLLSLFSTETFIITLSIENIFLGLTVASVIGILSGIIPAMMASRMDPVIAIRST
ncbi:ABC transporter permease [Rapidithrix thailandica]|uniref:ABC transporter permease n=1 Tax=Rapidithrix thailandica TaxID=413964 RepID=A0AAW9RPD5_9BACT